MVHRVNPAILKELTRFGAKDIKACFNCGNCTAICPHTEGNDANFPRRLIRYAQIGSRDGLIGSKDLWVCYYCGQCSDTCPREAEPGEFMAAARRYAIASYDPTGIGRLLNVSPLFNVAAFVVTAVVLGWLLLFRAGPISGEFFNNPALVTPGKDEPWFKGFMSFPTVHDVGIGVGVLAGLFLALGVANMVRKIYAAGEIPLGSGGGAREGGGLVAGIVALVRELVSHQRYKDCSTEHTKPEPWYLSRWFLHWTMFWGFLCLLVATTIDYLFKPVGLHVPVWYLPRLIGTVGGLLFIYGTGLALYQRFQPESKYAENSRFTDWIFIFYMFLLALTGVLLEVLVYAAPATVVGNVILYVHVVLAFQLILMLPFTKFAHVVYRSLAVFVHAFRGKEVAAEPVAQKLAA